ncbi:ParA family protein [Halobacteriovorax sp. CON-3]|uniref:ParA family protein n=1 Tax=Halobacteriovorax sp. CON-3 TaxID=3157710 RepID=UPI003716542F
MINASEVARNCNVSLNTIKSDLDILFGMENIKRTKPKTGKILLTSEQARKVYDKRNCRFLQRIVTFGNQKGGVGKSLLTTNTAIKKAKEGARVLIIDLDPESCASNFLLNIDELSKDYKTMLEVFRDNLVFKDAIKKTKYANLDIVPCKSAARRVDKFVQNENLSTLMSKKMIGLEEYDLIFFEIPPTFSTLIESAYITSDLVVMPCFPDSWSIESSFLTNEDILESAEKWNIDPPEIRIILNKFNDKRNASQEAWKVLTNEFGEKVLPFTIKDTAELQNSINDGKSIFDKGVRASKLLKESFSDLANTVCPIVQTETTRTIQ